MAVTLGTFHTQYQFTVVQHLTVDCLLGADFLQDFGAVLDCRSHTLTLGTETRHNIPITLGKEKQSTHSDVSVPDSFAIRSPYDLTIPRRTIQLITGRIEGQHTNVANVLVEPLGEISNSVHFCVARCLSALSNNSEVILQVMNVGPMPITVYKGMHLATALPEREILTINHAHADTSGDSNTFPNLDQVDLSHLSTNEQQELTHLLLDFHSLFPAKGSPLGQTSVVGHSISTTGHPIHQPESQRP